MKTLPKLTPKQLHYLQHSLGLDDHGQGRQYRNHYVIGPECDGYADLRELMELGMMKEYGPREIAGGMHTFTVTPDGIDAVAFQSPPPPRVSRDRRRYLDFLHSDSSFTFGEWLKNGYYKERLT